MHHGDVARNHIIRMAVNHVSLAVRSPAEVNGNLTIVIGQALNECIGIAEVLRQSLGNLQSLGSAVHKADAVRIGGKDIAQ